MMKKLLALFMVLAAASLFAAECKNCGCDTRKVTVYRCKKCRTFFCDNCRQGDKVEETGISGLDDLAHMSYSLSAVKNGGVRVVCPECSTGDVIMGNRARNGRIQVIR